MSNFNIVNNSIGNLIAGDNNNVNFGKPPRHLNKGLEEQLKTELSASDNITITAVMGDQEAFRFANEIKNYLCKQNYNVTGVNQAIYNKPVTGQILDRKAGKEQVDLIIGSQE